MSVTFATTGRGVPVPGVFGRVLPVTGVFGCLPLFEFGELGRRRHSAIPYVAIPYLGIPYVAILWQLGLPEADGHGRQHDQAGEDDAAAGPGR